jgi:hypothetical protein
MKKLIVLLESLTNKKVILEDSVFKSRKMDERLLPFKQKLEKRIAVDESNKTIVVNKILSYEDCLVLEKFYQGYLVNVEGGVNLCDYKLKQLSTRVLNFLFLNTVILNNI